MSQHSSRTGRTGQVTPVSEAYSIDQAHRDGRHASTHPADRKFWIAVGCLGCQALAPGATRPATASPQEPAHA